MIFDDLHIKKLNEAKHWSLEKLRPFRDQRMYALRQLVGYNYGDNGCNERVPINMIELGLNIYGRQVIARNPRAACSSIDRTQNLEAEDLEVALNYRIEQMRLELALRECFIEAMFCMGVMKVGVEYGDEQNVFATPVYFDDWVQDMNARRPDEWTFCGNRYRIPLEDAQQNEGFDPKVRKQLTATKRGPTHLESEDQRSQMLTTGEGPTDTEYIDHVELWDIWLPREHVILTLCAEHDTMAPLRIAEWSGPKRGPYHTLGLGDVPGNAIPLAPVSMWMDLHEIINVLFNKLGRQADRQKTNLLVSRNATEDGETVMRASDGQVLSVNDPNAFKEVSHGGIHNSNFAFMIQAQQLLKQLGGNWDSLGGLGANSETLGQDKLIAESSSQRIADIRDRVLSFAKDIITDIGEYEWKDPVTERRLMVKIPGSDIEREVDWTPDTRNGDYYRFNISVDPYSMQSQTPGSKLNALNQVVQGLLIPALPMLQQQGQGLDFPKLLSFYAKYGDLPELLEIITNMPPSEETRMPLRGSPVTRRENVRKSVPQQQGMEMQMMQMLMQQGMQ